MSFDSSSPVLEEMRRQLRLNPNMIRFSIVKTGDKLGGAANQSGKIEDQTGVTEWNSVASGETMKIEAGDIFAQAQSGSLRRY